MTLLPKKILSIQTLKKNQLDIILEKSTYFDELLAKKEPNNSLKGKIMASLFFEPSTRTRLSFETAMYRLGGSVITASEAGSSSAAKGESLKDTGSVIEQYADLAVIRHPQVGAAKLFSENINIPVINAGDGSGEHPSQALLDLYTLKKEYGEIDGLTIGLAGDLRYSRTIRSLVSVLSNYSVKILLFSPKELKPKSDLLEQLNVKKIPFEICDNIEEIVKKSDVLYSTRIQKERFKEEISNAHCYHINRKIIEANNPNIRIMHPLPRLDEIHTDLDDFFGSIYFKQVGNGVAVRMALIHLVLNP